MTAARSTAEWVRHLPALSRLVLSLAIGALLSAGLWLGWRAEVRLSIWLTTAVVFVALTWAALGPMDAAATEDYARRRDLTNWLAVILIIVATMVSLTSVIVVMFRHGSPIVVFLTTIAVFTSWMSIHLLFAAHYARCYFADPVGGINFNDDDLPPVFLDFAYVALTVGMSFAVSDTNLGTTAMRRPALLHALLSYLFGTVVLALVINLISGLS